MYTDFSIKPYRNFGFSVAMAKRVLRGIKTFNNFDKALCKKKTLPSFILIGHESLAVDAI